jgi:hypothetical protein
MILPHWRAQVRGKGKMSASDDSGVSHREFLMETD